MVDLKGKPFYLNDEQIEWVYDTVQSMSLEKKAGQLFCPMGFNNDPAFLNHIINEIGIGGLMYRPDMAENIQSVHRAIQDMAEIPLLLGANVEAGGNGIAFEGTSFGQPMAVSASNDPQNAYRMGYVACSEGRAVGMNWAFAPIVDINYDFHNPITNVRTFGSDPDKVIAYAKEYLRAAKENDVAVAIKHFPGDGVDERDQHILTSVNNLSPDEWDASYGRVYRELIDQGAQSVMVGHIALPEYVKKLKPQSSRKDQLMPASLSAMIMTDLLRKKLGFNGLISTDSTPMVGFTTAMKRKDAIPQAIAAGADMILFNKSLDEDYAYMLEGIRSGILSIERLDEAVTRILATKTSLGLIEKKERSAIVPKKEALSAVGCEKHRLWAERVADQAITLVKDEQSLLPISPAKFKRVYLNVIQKDLSVDSPVVDKWKTAFEDEGFEVRVRNRTLSISVADMLDPEHMSDEKRMLMHEMYRSVEEMKKDYDLYVYIVNMENASNNTTLRLNWNVAFGLGDDAPWMVEEIPMMMISTAYPYHLFDAPMMKTYINTYSCDDAFIRSTMAKIMGRSEFKGVSPIDPYCGKEYLG
ncbi:MAG: glycoside hydrolase family 3 protein [Erysipelotrichaceae bacterium]|nr:glycoside hydrolase family 3 protein [Erysipelotrichaceae bacterium]